MDRGTMEYQGSEVLEVVGSGMMQVTVRGAHQLTLASKCSAMHFRLRSTSCIQTIFWHVLSLRYYL